MKNILASAASIFLSLSIFAQGTATSTAVSPVSTPAIVNKLKQDIPELLRKSDVPGLSIAVIRNGEIVYTGAFGMANVKTGKQVTETTVFEAASLSKPVFAYAVLKLVDQGKLDLDTPLNKYLGNNYDVVNDDRINLITARHILSHTSGFPNWRSNDHTDTLLIHFTPGQKWQYSGEGMVYLSKVVEKITGMRFEDFMQEYALKPLNMSSSSYIWRGRFDSLKAFRHDMIGNFRGRNQPDDGRENPEKDHGNAAASLTTNAGDYAKFIVAILNGTGLKDQTWKQMFTPQVRVNEKYPPLAWGLGIGLETMPEGAYCWHWGDNGDAKAYMTAFLPEKNAVVYFADGSSGLSFTKEILDDAIGGDHPALSHLDYDTYNSHSRLFLKAVIDKGARKALKTYKNQLSSDGHGHAIDEDHMNDYGYLMLRLKRFDDAIALFQQNATDHPDSWNAWDSLGEAFAAKGDKKNAIKYYEKSIQLNPKNSNAEKIIKQLKS